MQLELDENQSAIADLALRILRESLTRERLRAIEATDDRIGRDEWTRLADAGLLGVPFAEDVGGTGLGIVEACLVLEQIGRTVAPVPYLATVVGAGMTIDRFGSAAQRERILPKIVDGTMLLAPALSEDGDELATRLPRTTARRDASRWRLDGEKALVPVAHVADLLLVPARTGDVATVVLVDPRDAGVTMTRVESTAGDLLSTVRLSGAAAEALGDDPAIVPWIVRHLTAGLCAMQAAVCAEALRHSAAHVSEREQFGQ
jgi:acyl-CoA dehydrogenase